MGHDLDGQLDGPVRLHADSPSKLIGHGPMTKPASAGFFSGSRVAKKVKQRRPCSSGWNTPNRPICLCPSRASHAPTFSWRIRPRLAFGVETPISASPLPSARCSAWRPIHRPMRTRCVSCTKTVITNCGPTCQFVKIKLVMVPSCRP